MSRAAPLASSSSCVAALAQPTTIGRYSSYKLSVNVNTPAGGELAVLTRTVGYGRAGPACTVQVSQVRVPLT